VTMLSNIESTLFDTWKVAV